MINLANLSPTFPCYKVLKRSLKIFWQSAQKTAARRKYRRRKTGNRQLQLQSSVRYTEAQKKIQDEINTIKLARFLCKQTDFKLRHKST